MELEALIREQERIIALRPLEACEALNNTNREIIIKYKETKESAFLGRINYQKSPSDLILTKYEGQEIYNSDYDFVIDIYDERLICLISEWRNKGSCKALDKVFLRIEELDGILLIWS